MPHDFRSDNKQDCSDVSDEKQCQIVSLDEEKYLKDKTPLYTGNRELSQYYVMDFQITSAEIKSKDGVEVTVTLGRKLLGNILSVYVPTILLNVIGHSTNFFKSFFFEAMVIRAR